MTRKTLLVLALSMVSLMWACSRSQSDATWTPVPLSKPVDPWFEEQIGDTKTPVLIDFTATWCPPCQEMKPDIHKLEAAYGSRLKVVEVDIDERGNLASHFEVGAIPHLMLLKNGQIVNRSVGGRDYSDLLKFVEAACGQP
ncbi:MAG: thioredoxin family protein [Planctomycetota bacterium]|nr:MAG: thioredoxin family protein [Planctomycetota bacterium]